MKKAPLILFVLLFFSCEKRNIPTSNQIKEDSSDFTFNPYQVPDSLLIPNSYLVLMNEKKFEPVLSESNAGLLSDSIEVKALEKKIYGQLIDFAKEKGLQIDPNQVLVNSLTGFVLENVELSKLKELKADKQNIARIQQNFRLGMETIRARMQSDVLAQTVRARMQENPQWGYDEENFTSKAIIYLAGTDRKINKQNKIWVVDSGIDKDHQDLKNQVDQNLSRSFVLRNASVFDSNPFFDFWGHGTHCAGLAAAKSMNQGNPDRRLIGMNGVAPGAPLVSLKVFGQEGYAEFTWVLQALEYASSRSRLKEGDVISMSLGGRVSDCAQDGLMAQMLRISNFYKVSIVVAAGNGYFWTGEPASGFLPACVNGEKIYTIGSVDLDYLSPSPQVNFSAFSNFGLPPIDWVVPGNMIFSTYPNDKYAVMGGTSMSAALMSGLLYLSQGNIRTKTTVADQQGNNYPIPEK